MKKTILFLLVLVFTGAVTAQSLGVAPAYISLGTQQRGETEEITLFATSNADTPFNVRPSYHNPFNSDTFSANSNNARVSEEDISGWITFTQDTYAVTPDEGTEITLSDGLTVFSNGNITFELKIPRNAEPGLHSGRIRLTPQTGGGTGYGASVVTQSSTKIQFRVPGEAERDLQLVDVNAYRVRENTVRIDTQIRNRGTVTATANSTRFLIENFVGENMKSISGGSVKLQPQESEWITSYWTGEDIEAGEYTLKGSVNYITGKSFSTRGFSINERINITSPEQVQEQEEDQRDQLPLWLVGMFLVLVGVLMYSFEIDPIWILATIAFAAISIFILMTDVSNSLLLVLLTSAGIILYIGWK